MKTSSLRLLAALLAALPSAAIAQAAPSTSVRGLWADAFGPGLKTPAQVSGLVEGARALNVNVIFAQAVRRADCLCNRSSLPRATDADLAPGFDPLADLTAKAHAAGLKVIAWVTVTGAWNRLVPNSDPQHLTRAHGPGAAPAQDWLNHRADGSSLLGDDLFLDPANLQAAEYMLRGVTSLVKNYPVDGVQLDRIRSPDGGGWGYNPASLARYRAETGAKARPAPADPAFSAWKRQQVTNLVRRLYLEVKRIRPEAWVSAATIVYGDGPADLTAFQATRTQAEVLQDWPTWLREGLLDLNVLMNYKTEGKGEQAQWYDRWNRFATALPVSPGTLLASGSALYLNTPEASAAQASRALAAGLGWVGYAYRNPTLAAYRGQADMVSALDALRVQLTGPDGALAEPVAFPDAPPLVSGLLGRVSGRPVPGGVPVEAYQQGALVARTVSDGAGYYGFAHLPPGETELRVAGQRWRETVWAGRVVRVPDFLLRDVQPSGRQPSGRGPVNGEAGLR